jgi:hypothetical protein
MCCYRMSLLRYTQCDDSVIIVYDDRVMIVYDHGVKTVQEQCDDGCWGEGGVVFVHPNAPAYVIRCGGALDPPDVLCCNHYSLSL